MNEHERWAELAQQLRVDSVRAAEAGGSGHPTSSMSAAELMAVLASKYLHYEFDKPENPNNDHLIFSKGHASPLLYALYKAVGAIAVNDLVEVGSTVQFHVRDAATADEDLQHLLHGHLADGALLFTCNGRGTRLFGRAHHDAAVLDEQVGAPAAGFFAAGEFGPVGGRNFVHGFTASIALLREH